MPDTEFIARFDRHSIQWNSPEGSDYRVVFTPEPVIVQDGVERVRQVKSHLSGYYDKWDGDPAISVYFRPCSLLFRDEHKKLVMFSRQRCTEVVTVKPGFEDRVHILIGMLLTARHLKSLRHLIRASNLRDYLIRSITTSE